MARILCLCVIISVIIWQPILTGCNKYLCPKINKPKIIDSLTIEKMRDSILIESGEERWDTIYRKLLLK
jgi:hypothetical protein